MTTFGTLQLDPAQDAEFQARLGRLRAQWVAEVAALVQAVTAWATEAAAAHGWSLEPGTLDLSEEVVGGAYTVPSLVIHAGENDLHLEPIARGVLGAEGRVDLYAWPSLFRVMLLRKNGGWVVRTESGLDWPQPWGRDTFVALAEGLLKAE